MNNCDQCHCKVVYVDGVEHRACCMCGHRYAVQRENRTGDYWPQQWPIITYQVSDGTNSVSVSDNLLHLTNQGRREIAEGKGTWLSELRRHPQ